FYLLFFFFFSSRRRHTRSDRDWSSDVCSSDLAALVERHLRAYRLSGDQLLRGAQAAPCTREPRAGGSQAARDVRKARDPDRGAEAPGGRGRGCGVRSEEHTSELQSRSDLVCRLLREKKKKHGWNQ